jgi:hypothetical protein
MTTATLMNCRGSKLVTREEVAKSKTPDEVVSTDSGRSIVWKPIPHVSLIENILSWADLGGMKIKKESHALSVTGDRYFGVFDLEAGGDSKRGLAVGLRNSHDKRFCASVAVGDRVVVCDNLSFSGEITLARKHTRHILRDLPRLCADAFGKIAAMREHQDALFASYESCPLTDAQAHDVVIRSVDAKVIANANIPDVLDHWRSPRHMEFMDRNVWSLFNAYTEVAKRWNPFELPARTQRLHGMLNALVQSN